jgi:hypothetical protein
MQPPAKPEGEPDSVEDDSEPGRSRDAERVEEARIAAAGGGIRQLPTVWQALTYLIIVSAFLGAIWWALSR